MARARGRGAKGPPREKGANDAKAAERAAEQADADAAYAIDHAYAAVEEAQYAVLDAELAHRHADELAQT